MVVSKPAASSGAQSSRAAASRPSARASSTKVTPAMEKQIQQMKSLPSDSEDLLRSVLEIGWNYLTLVDANKIFEKPVRHSRL